MTTGLHPDPEDLEDEEAPRQPEVRVDNGLFCFLNADRACGSDCMAYTADAGEGPLAQQQKNCLLLVSVDRLSRSNAVIASMAHKMQETSAKEMADRRRATQSSPPKTP